MIDRLDQIFVLLATLARGLSAGRAGSRRPAWFWAWSCIIGLFPGLFALDHGAGAQGAGPHAEPAWAESRGAVWVSAAGGGRHQVADQGRYCSAQRRRGGAFSGAAGCWWSRSSWDLPCCPWAATWCWWIWMPACCSFSPWALRRSFRSSWPAGRAATNIRCWARCARWRR